MNTGNETVDYLSKINFVGNVIPNNWFNNIKFESGKVDINSILILSELVYWHRPTIVKDEVSGDFIGYKKRFKADKLQKNYESLANQFGLTKRQVKESTDRLQNMNLIQKEFRNIKTPGGPINNVLYFSVNHLEVERITFNSDSDIRSNVTRYTTERDTNTVITTVNTTNNNNNTSSPKATKKDKYNSDSPYYQMAQYLYGWIKKNNPIAKEPNWQQWSDDFRKIVEIDKRETKDIKQVIDFSQTDDFWHTNILSPSKLRKQYEQLYGKSIKPKKQVSNQIYNPWEEEQNGQTTNTTVVFDNSRQLSIATNEN